MNTNLRIFLLVLLLQTLWFSGQKVAAQCYEMQLRPILLKGKYGAVDVKTGKLVIKPKFAAADSFPGNYMLVAEKFVKDETAYSFSPPTLWTSGKVTNKLGLVNAKGELVLPIKYHRISAPDCDHFLVEEKGRTQLLDKNFRVIYEDTAHFTPNLIANQVLYERRLNDTLADIRIKDLKTGKVIYQQQAYDASPISHLYFEAGNLRKYRVLPFYQIRSRQLIKGETDMAVREYKRIVDRRGTTLFDSIYSGSTRNGITQMSFRKGYLIADTNFQLIPALNGFDQVYRLETSKPWFTVIKKGQQAILDVQGKVLMPFTDKGNYTYVGKNAFLLSEPWGTRNEQIIFLDGRTLDLRNYLIDHQKDTLLLSRPLVVENKETRKKGLLNLDGKLLLRAIYDHLFYATNKLLFYQNGDEIGYITPQGKTLVPGKYTGLSAFKEGYAVVVQKQPEVKTGDQIKLTFIDSTGKEFPGGLYENVSAFKDGFARVIRNDSVFMIDRQGRRARIGKYTLQSHFSDQKIAVISNKAQTIFGLITLSGKVVVKPRYEKITVTEIDRYQGCTCALFSPKNYLPELLTVMYPKIENGTIEATMKVKKLRKF